MSDKRWKYLGKPEILLILLDRKKIIKLDDKRFIEMSYKINMGKKLDLDNPQTFNEKLQWLKLNDRKDIYSTMVDKYEVKKYVSNIIGERYIIPTLGVYDSFDEIDFTELPEQFVLKCTHDSGGLVICKNKEELNIRKERKKFKKLLNTDFFRFEREWPYKNVKPRIIAEKYMATENQKELIDYKFFCINGKPEFIYISEGLSNHETAKMSFADMNYRKTEFYRKDYKPFDTLPPKPKKFEEMKQLAMKLCKDIPFVRVDFYEIDGNIYFGELTFFPCAGYIPFYPEKYDRVIGKMLKINFK